MKIEVCKGQAGLALYVDDKRLAGARHNGIMETVLSAEIPFKTLRARLSQAGAGGGVEAAMEVVRMNRCRHAGTYESSPFEFYPVSVVDALLAALAPSPSAGEPVARVTIEETGPVCKYFTEIEGRLEPLALGTYDLYLATPPATPVQPTASVEVVRGAWSFLQDRLLEFEQEIGCGEEEREWAGHVMPALSRFGSLIAALAPSAIPSGWKLVPIEPTGEMIGQGGVASFKSDLATGLNERAGLIAAYHAMVEAAPPSPATPEPVSAPAGEVVERVLGEICEDMLDMHHGRQAPMEVDAASFGRGAANGWDAAVSAFYKRALAALSNPAPGHGEGGL